MWTRSPWIATVLLAHYMATGAVLSLFAGVVLLIIPAARHVRFSMTAIPPKIEWDSRDAEPTESPKGPGASRRLPRHHAEGDAHPQEHPQEHPEDREDQ